MATQTQPKTVVQTVTKNPVRWFEIYVQDLNRAKTFYESVFKIKLAKLKTPPAIQASKIELWSYPSNDEGWGCSGALVRMDGVPSGMGGTMVYFGSDDCAEEEKRIIQYGGRIHRSKTDIGEHGFITLAMDTEGNMIGLHSMK